jgi:predicted CoA-binding protein
VITDPQAIAALVRGSRTIAVLGAHPDGARAAGYVPDALFRAGFVIWPVNPKFAGQTLYGRPILASLPEIDDPIDIVDVFRRSVDLPPHVPEILGMKHRPGAVWLQSGIRNDAVAAQLEAAGIQVVQDRCLMIDQRRFGGPRAP